MSFDAKKLGLDRIATGLSRAGARGNSRLVTGDISRGEIVEHTTSSGNVEYVQIRARATAAFPVSIWFSNAGSADINWDFQPDQNRIAVKTSTGTACTFKFWVF